MTAKKLSSCLIAGIVLTVLALVPNISYGQDRDSISVRYGSVGGAAINVDLDERVDIPVYIYTRPQNYVADIHLVLGANGQYIDSLLSEDEGEWLYPFTEWEFVSFSDIYTDPNPEGWTAQAFFGWARINPMSEAPWLNTGSPMHVLTFMYKTNNDQNNIGDDANAIGPGLSPYQGPSNAGDTLGGVGFNVNERFAPFHFVGGGYIEGTVTNSDMDPIEGVSVVNEATGKETFTDDEGFYHMGLYPGMHNFTFSHPDYLPVEVNDINIIIDVTVTQDVVMLMLGSIAGTVTDADDNPIEGVTVSAGAFTDVTAADGTYHLSGLTAGTYDVEFTHVDYLPHTETGVVVTIDETTVVDVQLDHLGGIAGTVTRLGTGAPIEGVIVQIFSEGRADTTDNNGHYAFEMLDTDTYELYFGHPDYRDETISDIDVTLNTTTIVDLEMEFGVGIDDHSSSMPMVFSMDQNYPNPFNATTTIEYALPEDANVTIDIYDLLGRRVASLVNGHQFAGYHQVSWNANRMTSGMYFYKIQANDFVEQKSMMLLK